MAKRRLDVKELKTPADLQALANTARVQIVDVLQSFGQATVSQLAAATGLAIGSVSHHLRTLEAADIARRVDQPESPDRRKTWWEPAHRDGFKWDPDLSETDWGAAGLRAHRAAIQALDLATRRVPVDDLPESWRAGRIRTDFSMRLTPEEVRQLGKEILELLRKYRDLGDDEIARDNTVDRRPFEVDVDGYPYRPPKRRS